MPARIVWLETAEQDLQATYDHIFAASPRAAVRYAEDIIAATQRLAEFPESARRYDSSYRILPVRNHLVFYRYDQAHDQVLIAAVLDGRRDIARLIDRNELRSPEVEGAEPRRHLVEAERPRDGRLGARETRLPFAQPA
jgi:plasmid stabilization system protein ParE